MQCFRRLPECLPSSFAGRERGLEVQRHAQICVEGYERSGQLLRLCECDACLKGYDTPVNGGAFRFAEAAVGIVPDPLAFKIVSTPGSTIVFLFEYTFGGEIPAAIANDALVQLLDFLAETARFLNSLSPPQPTLLLVP